MTPFQFRCLLLAIVALSIAAIASAAFSPITLFLALIAAGLALFLYSRSR